MDKGENIRRSIGGLVIGTFFFGMASWAAWQTVSLARDGTETVARVKSYNPIGCGNTLLVFPRTCHYHYLSADGHVFRLDLDQPFAIGSPVDINYLSHDLSVARPGRIRTSPWESLRQDIWYIVFGFLIGVACFWGATIHLRRLRIRT